MKQADVTTLLNNGQPLMIGQYWSGKCETITMRDKQNGGQRRTAHVVRETVLGATDPIAITRFLRDDEKPELWKPSANKGDKVLVRIQGMETNLGAISMQGVIERLE